MNTQIIVMVSNKSEDSYLGKWALICLILIVFIVLWNRISTFWKTRGEIEIEEVMLNIHAIEKVNYFGDILFEIESSKNEKFFFYKKAGEALTLNISDQITVQVEKSNKSRTKKSKTETNQDVSIRWICRIL